MIRSSSPPEPAAPGLEQIGACLRLHAPFEDPERDNRRAAVALILRGQGGPCELLFIQRATHGNDPWSGDIGLPGGKLQPGESVADAARRETFEELELDLSTARSLGRLDDLRGAHLPVTVSCLVYALSGAEPALRPSREVADAFWFPLAELLDPARHGTYPVTFGTERLLRPGIRLAADRPILWGITYRLLDHFCRLLDRPFPR